MPRRTGRGALLWSWPVSRRQLSLGSSAAFKYLINNGRTNLVWQNAYLDQDNEFVMDRFPTRSTR